MIDLGRWLDEEIGLPHEGGPAPESLGRGETSDSPADNLGRRQA